MKTCNKCNIEKKLEEFPQRKISKDGRRGACKICTNKQHKKHREKESYKLNKKENWNKWYTKEYYVQYRINNRDKINNIQNKHKKKRRKLEKLSSYPEYKKEIKNFYKNRPEGFDVDHIMPLCHKNFCGLHVPWNLQYLPKEENRKKRNNVTW